MSSTAEAVRQGKRGRSGTAEKEGKERRGRESAEGAVR